MSCPSKSSRLGNLLSLYQRQTTPARPHRQPGPLRTAVLLAGAVLGTTGRDLVLKLSVAWGEWAKHKPLEETALNWLRCTPPKSVPPLDRWHIGGSHI